MKIENFISYEQPTNYIVHSDQYTKDGQIPVLTAGQSFVLGYTDEEDGIYTGEPVVIFDDFTTSVQYVDFPFKVKSSAMKILKNKQNANIKFCYYLLSWLQKMPPNHKRQWISTTSQIDINLPPIEWQKKIVQKIEAVSNIIKYRKEELKKLDELVSARFVEMFGNPILNPNGYLKEKIEKHIDLLTGYPFKSEQYIEEGINICGGLIIMPQKIKWNECVHWSSVEGFEDYLLNENDIVMALDRPWISEGFKMAKVDAEHLPALLIQRTARIRAIDMNQDYLYYCFINGGFDKHSNVTGSLVPHISAKDIRSFEIMIPPTELQKQFADFVHQVDKSKVAVKKALDETQLLFDSLMQKYFG